MKDTIISWCVSGSGAAALALDRKACLWRGTRRSRGSEHGLDGYDWQRYDFNEEYNGYYPACRFTAIAWTGGGFLAAGQEQESGRIVAYSSLRGGVWQPENLVARTPEGPVIPQEPVYDICQDAVSGQIFLVGGKGQVITLNGCPKCVKISFFGDRDIRHGSVDGEYLRLTLADGGSTEIHLNAAMQLHLSREAAEKLLQKGALLIDVGDEVDEAENDGTDVVVSAEQITSGLQPDRRLPLTGVNACLRELRESGNVPTLIFTCTTGIRAEAAAKTARAQGVREAYYIKRERSHV